MSSHGSGGVPLPILQGPPKHKDPVCGMMVCPGKSRRQTGTRRKNLLLLFEELCGTVFPTTRKRF